MGMVTVDAVSEDPKHVAAAIEDSARIDNHAWRVNFAVTTPLASISTRPLAKITPSNRRNHYAVALD